MQSVKEKIVLVYVYILKMRMCIFSRFTRHRYHHLLRHIYNAHYNYKTFRNDSIVAATAVQYLVLRIDMIFSFISLVMTISNTSCTLIANIDDCDDILIVNTFTVLQLVKLDATSCYTFFLSSIFFLSPFYQ